MVCILSFHPRGSLLLYVLFCYGMYFIISPWRKSTFVRIILLQYVFYHFILEEVYFCTYYFAMVCILSFHPGGSLLLYVLFCYGMYFIISPWRKSTFVRIILLWYVFYHFTLEEVYFCTYYFATVCILSFHPRGSLLLYVLFCYGMYFIISP
jgi:hypothetical protein